MVVCNSEHSKLTHFLFSSVRGASRKLTQDMETTKVALENERKIQQLQMQAINALWKKVSTMQSTSNTSTADLMQTSQSFAGIENNSTAVVQDLAKTCSVLTNQVGFADFMRFSYITNHQFDCRCNNCRAPCATFSNA